MRVLNRSRKPARLPSGSAAYRGQLEGMHERTPARGNEMASLLGQAPARSRRSARITSDRARVTSSVADRRVPRSPHATHRRGWAWVRAGCGLFERKRPPSRPARPPTFTAFLPPSADATSPLPRSSCAARPFPCLDFGCGLPGPRPKRRGGDIDLLRKIVSIIPDHLPGLARRRFAAGRLRVALGGASSQRFKWNFWKGAIPASV